MLTVEMYIGDKPIGTISLNKGKFTPKPDTDLFHKILQEPIFLPKDGELVDIFAKEDPVLFIKSLCLQYKSAAGLRASRAVEKESRPTNKLPIKKSWYNPASWGGGSGGTCKPGERADLTGCTPANHDGGKPRNALPIESKPEVKPEKPSESPYNTAGSEELKPKKSNAELEIGTLSPEAQKTVKDVLGDTSIEEVPSLIGAPDDAKVKVTATVNSIKVKMNGDGYGALRSIMKDNQGKKFIYNTIFEVVDKGKGLGLQVFADEVANAAANGFSYIECHAAGDGRTLQRDGKNAEYNGFYTWPRFGYDCPLNELSLTPALKKTIGKNFPDAKSVLDIMSTREGRDWWKANGVDIPQAKFDLSPNSRSMQVLQAYLKERKGESK